MFYLCILSFPDSPTTPPNPQRRINNAESFHIVFKANFKGHKLIYNAEIDGVEAPSVGCDLEELQLVEAKSRMSNYPRPLLEWSQCYFSGITKLVRGLVTRDAKLRSVTVVNPEQILVSNEEPLFLLSATLDRVKHEMRDIDDPNIVLKFNVSPSAIRSSRYHEMKSFLPEAFVRKIIKNL